MLKKTLIKKGVVMKSFESVSLMKNESDAIKMPKK